MRWRGGSCSCLEMHSQSRHAAARLKSGLTVLLKQVQQETFLTPAGALGMSPKGSPREKKIRPDAEGTLAVKRQRVCLRSRNESNRDRFCADDQAGGWI